MNDLRRKISMVIVAVMVLLLIGGCASTTPPAASAAPAASGAPAASDAPDTSDAPPADATEDKGTIKIGFLTALSGNFAALGTDSMDSFKMYLEQHDNKLGGFNVEVVYEDDGTDPNTAYTKAQKLVNMDGAHILVGPSNTPTANAVISFIDDVGIPLYMATSGGDDIQGPNRSPYSIRQNFTSSQCMHPLGEYVANEMGLKTAAVLSYDMAFGYEVVGGFQKVFEENGGKVIYKVYVPQPTQDFSPYLMQLPMDDIDVFVYQVAGGDSLRIQKQLKEYGFIGKVPIVAGMMSTDESLLDQFEPETEGFITAMMYSRAAKNAANEKLNADFEAYTGRGASLYTAQLWTAAMVLDQALTNLTFEDVSDGLKVIDAINDVSLDNVPVGSISFDEYNQGIIDVNIRKVEMVNGVLQNTVVKTVPAVRQDWKWGLDAFFAQPYTKDYPATSSK